MKLIKKDEHWNVHPVFEEKRAAEAYIDKRARYSNQFELIAVYSHQKQKRIFRILSH